MKKILYTIVLGAAVVLTACNRDVENIFDESAAERTEKMIAQVEKNLTEAPNGWELRYFANPESAGYALLCEFDADGSVVVAAKNPISSNNQYKEERSLWATDASQAPTLSFNSYNDLISIFADPGSDGVGYNGDYEFIIMQPVTAEKILLKGKKHGAYISMNRLDEDVKWRDYFKAIDDFNDKVFTDNNGIDMTLCFSSADSAILTYEDGRFTYKIGSEETTQGFVITPSGLHFYKGLLYQNSTNKVLATDFVINDDYTALVSTDQTAFIVPNYSALQFFQRRFEQKARWIYLDTDTDEATQNAIQNVRDALAAKGATLARLGYERYQKTSGQRVTYSYDLYVGYTVDNVFKEGKINLNYKTTTNGVSFSFKGIDTEKPLTELLARLDADPTTAAHMIADPLCDTFVLSSYTGSTLNMVQMYLTAGDKKIHVVADKELY